MRSERINRYLNNITGNAKEFSLEARIFHFICIFLFVIISLSQQINLYYGLYELAVLMGALQIIGTIFFILSRVYKKTKLSIIFFSLGANVLFVINFYFNSGINGPGLIMFLSGIFLIILIVPKNQFAFWLSINIIEVLVLLLLSYHDPSIFTYRYSDSFLQYADIASTYVLTAILIFLATNFIRKSHNREKIIAEEKAEELRISDQNKNKLLSILAHDLSSPLSSIQNYLEILADLKSEEIDRQSIEASLLNETKNTQHMLSNLLVWSKTQMEGVKINLIPLNLKESIQTAIRIQQSLAIEKNISIEENIDQYIMVSADQEMLQLVIRNLINNSLKFTQAGGKVRIDSKVEESVCLITISDTGRGINHEMQKDLFSMGIKSTYGTQNEKGVGLGLSLCKEFTELQNGTISFESNPGKGTRFFIRFKLASALKP